MLSKGLVLVVLAVKRHVLGHDGHDLRVHVRPESVLVEHIAGNPHAGYARHHQYSDEPAEP